MAYSMVAAVKGVQQSTEPVCLTISLNLMVMFTYCLAPTLCYAPFSDLLSDAGAPWAVFNIPRAAVSKFTFQIVF